MPYGYSADRIVRIVLMASAIVATYAALQPFGLGWLIVPLGLLLVAAVVGIAMLRAQRVRKQILQIRDELEEMQRARTQRESWA